MSDDGLFPCPPNAYGGTAAARNDVICECKHAAHDHEGDEYGFCLACECNHYRPAIRAT